MSETLEQLKNKFIKPVGELTNGITVHYELVDMWRWECLICRKGKRVRERHTAVGNLRGHLKCVHRLTDGQVNIQNKTVSE